jgi:hypothetical protein
MIYFLITDLSPISDNSCRGHCEKQKSEFESPFLNRGENLSLQLGMLHYINCWKRLKSCHFFEGPESDYNFSPFMYNSTNVSPIFSYRNMFHFPYYFEKVTKPINKIYISHNHVKDSTTSC